MIQLAKRIFFTLGIVFCDIFDPWLTIMLYSVGGRRKGGGGEREDNPVNDLI